jgi:predicted phosphoadenosine phosphosulfate sulfurtransferase
MLKRPIGISVLEAAKARIHRTFDDFERVYLSFSAGKDSTIMLHLVADVARERGRKFGVLLVDLEGQYRLTMEHAKVCIDMYADVIELHWVCLPIHLRNAVSVYEPFWKCWDLAAKDAWIRPMPDFAVSDPAAYPFFRDGMEFEEFVPEFGEWYSQGKSCACLVGIRTDESLNRFRTVATAKKSLGRAFAGQPKSPKIASTSTPSMTGSPATSGFTTTGTRTSPTIVCMTLCTARASLWGICVSVSLTATISGAGFGCFT